MDQCIQWQVSYGYQKFYTYLINEDLKINGMKVEEMKMEKMSVSGIFLGF